MIPKPDQLEVISHMKSGDLAKTPYPVLLHALAVHRLSVILEIDRKQLRPHVPWLMWACRSRREPT